jgi:ABC-2 type transport system permease protein
LGKYLAAMIFWVTLWAPTLSYVWLVARQGEHTVDWGAISATYLGLFGVGMFYMAIGLFMSAVARNQIIAALLTFLALGSLFVVGILGFLNVDDSMRGVFEYLGLWTQMSSFAKGIVDTRHLVFDVSVAAMALFLSVQVLASNRGAA